MELRDMLKYSAIIIVVWFSMGVLLTNIFYQKGILYKEDTKHTGIKIQSLQEEHLHDAWEQGFHYGLHWKVQNATKESNPIIDCDQQFKKYYKNR